MRCAISRFDGEAIANNPRHDCIWVDCVWGGVRCKLSFLCAFERCNRAASNSRLDRSTIGTRVLCEWLFSFRWKQSIWDRWRAFSTVQGTRTGLTGLIYVCTRIGGDFWIMTVQSWICSTRDVAFIYTVSSCHMLCVFKYMSETLDVITLVDL